MKCRKHKKMKYYDTWQYCCISQTDLDFQSIFSNSNDIENSKIDAIGKQYH